MFGYDIQADIDVLQGLMSLCPQFDTLYPGLTAYQHLDFYLKFRGEYKHLTKTELNDFILSKLKEVDLDMVAHQTAGTFSGGMKRRLSLCLATLSRSARIVFLDEPSSGLDPLSRRKCWKVIQELKKSRVVVLTTHSMEEADALGDHVCIMHQARLRASGSTLFLKNRFGKGYQLSIGNRKLEDSSSDPSSMVPLKTSAAPVIPVASPTASSTPTQTQQQQLQESANQEASARTALEAYVKYAIPGCEVVSSAAGALTVAVNRQSGAHLAPFLKALKEGKMDWSISNSTLEEVSYLAIRTFSFFVFLCHGPFLFLFFYFFLLIFVFSGLPQTLRRQQTSHHRHRG
jgi:ABC-type multidrug transport system ATPase subunit